MIFESETRSRFLRMAALGLIAMTACASPTAAPADARACAGFVPPAVLAFRPVALPGSYAAVGLGGEVTDEVVIGPDGSVRGVRFAWANYPLLGPFAEESIKRSSFSPASIEGNPVAARVESVAQVGLPARTSAVLPYDSLWAFVPGGQSREARWQLAGSLERLEIVAHAGTVSGQITTVVAIGPSGAEKSLLTLAAGAPPQQARKTVRTGDFFAAAGDYRLELRAGDKTLATTTVTIAASFESAIVNACEPIRVH